MPRMAKKDKQKEKENIYIYIYDARRASKRAMATRKRRVKETDVSIVAVSMLRTRIPASRGRDAFCPDCTSYSRA